MVAPLLRRMFVVSVQGGVARRDSGFTQHNGRYTFARSARQEFVMTTHEPKAFLLDAMKVKAIGEIRGSGRTLLMKGSRGAVLREM